VPSCFSDLRDGPQQLSYSNSKKRKLVILSPSDEVRSLDSGGLYRRWAKNLNANIKHGVQLKILLP
jgi:hypothetical protein